MRKYYILFFVAIFIFSSCKKDSPVEAQVENPIGYYKFDIKTEFSDKMKSAGAKSGIKCYLKKSGWADVGEFGEDYSLWIVNLERTRGTDNSVTVDFNLELRTPAEILDGELIYIGTAPCRQHFRIKYNPNDEFDDVGNPLTPEAVLKSINSVIDLAQNSSLNNIPEAKLYIEGAKIISEFINIVLSLIDAGSTKEQQAEAFYTGGFSYDQVRKWILAIEK